MLVVSWILAGSYITDRRTTASYQPTKSLTSKKQNHKVDEYHEFDKNLRVSIYKLNTFTFCTFH
jgi:hypothetical protein